MGMEEGLYGIVVNRENDINLVAVTSESLAITKSGEIVLLDVNLYPTGEYLEKNKYQKFEVFEAVLETQTIFNASEDVMSVSNGPGCYLGVTSDHNVVTYIKADSVWNKDTDRIAEETKAWRDIVSVAAGFQFAVGLKTNGTIVTTDNEMSKHVRKWKDIVAIDVGYLNVVGLKSDGTVVVADLEPNIWDVSGWTDVVAIYAGYGYIIGIRKDGTILTAGDLYYIDKISGWNNIAAISCDGLGIHVVGVTKDGTL